MRAGELCRRASSRLASARAIEAGAWPRRPSARHLPGGSITGAPKIRACDIIAELERRRRDVYCGSIAHLGFDGAADLSIAIRTVEFEGAQARFGAGGGVTILSEGADEYRETCTKAARILAAFEAYANGAKART